MGGVSPQDRSWEGKGWEGYKPSRQELGGGGKGLEGKPSGQELGGVNTQDRSWEGRSWGSGKGNPPGMELGRVSPQDRSWEG